MADVRINALSTTATSAASDDYLALDGSANGTRKILATNIAQNVTDVTFGTSGPSAKSSIAARAARQGLVFDGTNTASVTLPAFGTGDFAFSFWQNVGFNANGYGTMIGGGFGALVQNFDGSGRLQLIRGDGVGGSSNSTSAVVVGKWEHWVISRSSGVVSWYKNGVSDGSSTCTADFTGTAYSFGRGGSYLNTGVVIPYIYNRALSAAEVVSLYESGVPSGADYNNASNTNLSTSAFTAYNTTSFTGVSATGFTAVSSAACEIDTNPNFAIAVGQRIRATFSITVNSGTVYGVLAEQGVGAKSATSVTFSTGTYSIELVATGASSNAAFLFSSTGASNFVVSNFSAVRAGLLLAPDAAQAGGGLTWYDTSGNAANITLPASGVSWNVPTSGNVTSGGALNLLAGGTNNAVTMTAAGNQIIKLNGGTGTQTIGIAKTSSGYSCYLSVVSTTDESLRIQNASGTNLVEFNKGGNVLIGTTTDGGQKLQVNGTVYASSTIQSGGFKAGQNGGGYLEVSWASIWGTAGGHGLLIGSSGETYLNSATGQSLRLQTNGGTTALTLSSSQNMTVEGTGVNQIKGTLIVGAQAAIGASLDVQTASGTASTFRLYQNGVSNWVWSVPASTDALVLSQYGTTEAMRFNSSRVAIFAGPVRLANAYTAGAVVTTGYVTIQDSSGTTYKIPVGT